MGHAADNDTLPVSEDAAMSLLSDAPYMLLCVLIYRKEYICLAFH